jgi:C_GCAxxG_C_C family probable redox protein
MLTLFRRRIPLGKYAVRHQDCAAQAGALFDRGYNCTQSVLQATIRRNDPDLNALSEGFGGGIGETGCLCGAIIGGVMALGLAGKADRAGQLMANFKETYRSTCCRSLSREYRWLSKEHLANCREITIMTAAMVEELLVD